MASHAATLLPTAAEFRERAYVPAVEGVRRSYARYREGVSQLAGVDARAAREAEKSYRELWDTLREKRVTAIGFAVVNLTIAREVQERGIPVPTRWDPRDRATFDAAVLERARKRGDEEYRRAVRDALGTGASLPPDLATFEAFLAAAPVQARLRRELELPTVGPTLRAAPAPAEFEGSVMAPLRRDTASLLSRAMSGDASALDGRLAAPAREAVRTTLAVGFALVLSALGAIGHLAKAANHLAALAGAPGWARAAATAALLGGLVAVSHTHSAPVQPGGSAWGAPVAWSVGAHVRISPFGDAMAALPGLDAVAGLADRMPWR